MGPADWLISCSTQFCKEQRSCCHGNVTIPQPLRCCRDAKCNGQVGAPHASISTLLGLIGYL